jgi:hypothetical protein
MTEKILFRVGPYGGRYRHLTGPAGVGLRFQSHCRRATLGKLSLPHLNQVLKGYLAGRGGICVFVSCCADLELQFCCMLPRELSWVELSWVESRYYERTVQWLGVHVLHIKIHGQFQDVFQFSKFHCQFSNSETQHLNSKCWVLAFTAFRDETLHIVINWLDIA